MKFSSIMVFIVMVAAAVTGAGAAECEGGSCVGGKCGGSTLPTGGWSAVIPADKKLPPEWVQSLFKRGVPTVYRGDALMKIGMPVGGIGCGTVYLGGDGKLWLWDIFNRHHEGAVGKTIEYEGKKVPPRNGAAYVAPATDQPSPFAQGFALRVTTAGAEPQVRALDRTGWHDVSFAGTYPVGTVNYADPACPVAVKLEAFSPFIPLDAESSGLPCTVMRYTMTNTGMTAASVEIGGWLENPVFIDSAAGMPVTRSNSFTAKPELAFLGCSASTEPPQEAVEAAKVRPDVVFEDFEKETYEGWTVKGTAFGSGPVSREKVPEYQGDLGMEGKRAVNSHATAPGASTGAKDAQTGSLVSREFVIAHKSITFLIGGGKQPKTCCLNLIVAGKVVRSATGAGNNKMHRETFNVGEFTGKTAHIEIVDAGTGGWGNIGVDQIVFSDAGGKGPVLSKDAPDYGTIGLAVLGGGQTRGVAKLDVNSLPGSLFGTPAMAAASAVSRPLVGGMVRTLEIAPGTDVTVTFAVAWHFPNIHLGVKGDDTGLYYSKKLKDAAAVAAHLAANEKRLVDTTLLWRDTWYDSTLPYWFLDRTFANTCDLATTTAYRFANGRFYGWEGTGCCPGTCSHVWGYAQAVGRLFPELERDVRERVDFGLAFHEDSGMIGYRAERGMGAAVDGQCMRILGTLREHQMSADGAFLKRNWPRVKKAVQFLIQHDKDGDGLLDGAQENTLDAAWFGKISWISSLYGAALLAGERMATDIGDAEFAKECAARAVVCRAAIGRQLFNSEWFVQKKDTTKPHALGTYESCAIDQVFGQSWAWQVGLGRVIDRDKTLSALRALWKYNFARDLGPFIRQATPKGRPYCMPGEGGLVMATNPLALPEPFGKTGWQTMYFAECMSGFEHQVASHMIAEGMVTEGLAVTRVIHDRYSAERRNPYNEVECGDHYARAMASYGSFVSACGFEYDGPKGVIGFDPRLTPDNFRTPFTAAEGWGTFSQQCGTEGMEAALTVKYGSLRVTAVRLVLPLGMNAGGVKVKTGLLNSPAATITQEGARVLVTLEKPIVLKAGESCTISIKAL